MTDAELLELLTSIVEDKQSKKDEIQTELNRARSATKQLESELLNVGDELNHWIHLEAIQRRRLEGKAEKW